MQDQFGNPENLSVKGIVEKYRYVQHVPYWQSEEITQWIDEKVYSNELQKELPLIEDADTYLCEINKFIPVAAYITIRPEAVITGTQNWLDKHNFPAAPVICRPVDVDFEDGNQWKAELLQKLYPNILGIVDDNAKLLEFLPADYKGTIFLYDHNSIDSQLNVIACPNWPHVYTEIKRFIKGRKQQGVGYIVWKGTFDLA